MPLLAGPRNPTIGSFQVILMVLLACGLTNAQPWDAFYYGDTLTSSRPNWMSQLADNTPLNAISIPGTHNAVSFYGGHFGQCQTLSLTNQLNLGVRALDIRPRHLNDRFPIYHGIVYQMRDLHDVLLEIKHFLRVNPRETILMRIKEEGEPHGNTRSFSKTLIAYASSFPGLFWPYTGNNNPQIGELRGKVVILQDFPGDNSSQAFGIPWAILNKQDDWDLHTRWDLYGKWEAIKAQLLKAIHGDSAYPNEIYVNFLSASGEGLAFPWFVASGQTEPTVRTLCPTGLSTPLSSSYPDFPRENCRWLFCSIDFMGTNMLTVKYFEHTRGRVGIVFADFPGPLLVDNIIALNGL